jgi:hypothetical protein
MVEVVVEQQIGSWYQVLASRLDPWGYLLPFILYATLDCGLVFALNFDASLLVTVVRPESQRLYIVFVR